MENIKLIQETDLKTVIKIKQHNIKIEDEHKYKDLPDDKEITVFTLHKEFYDLSKEQKIDVLKVIIDNSIDEIGKVRYSCGRYFTTDVAHTGNESKVTCKRCLKPINTKIIQK